MVSGMKTPTSISSPAIIAAAILSSTTAAAIEWAAAVDVATGNATRGPWQQNNSRYDFVDDAAVAVNDAGFVAVAWADLPNHDILFRLYDAAGKPVTDEPVNISRSPGIFSWIPKLVIGPGDTPGAITIHAIWQDIVFRGGGHGGEIFTATSRDGGRSFESPINLSDVIEGSGKGRTDPQRWSNGSYDLVVCPNGTVFAAWTEFEGRLWFSRSDDGGRTFTGKTHLAGGGDSPPTRAPALAAAADGIVHLAFTIGDTDAADIHLLRSSDGGRSFAPAITPQPSSDAYADAPAIALTAAGDLHMVFAESAGGPYTRPRLRHTVLARDGNAFSDPADVFPSAGDDAAAAAYPTLRIDRAGRLWLAWEHFPHHPGRPHGIGWCRSDDAGERFSTPSLVPGLGGPQAGGFNGSQQGLLGAKFDVSPAGRIAAANSLFIPDQSSIIRFATAEHPAPTAESGH